MGLEEMWVSRVKEALLDLMVLTTMNGSRADENSDLAYIDLKSDNPFEVFQEWHKEACEFSTGLPNALCLATVSKDLKVSARHLILRRLEEDGFVIYTDNRSRKAHDLAEVPSAAICFLWAYVNDKNQHIARQVRIEGTIKKLDREDYRDIYEKELLYCKIRAYVCRQGTEVDWDALKSEHDQLLQEVRNGRTLPMPDHFAGYKMYPKTIEFYYARDTMIGDRIYFEKSESDQKWSHKRIAA